MLQKGERIYLHKLNKFSKFLVSSFMNSQGLNDVWNLNEWVVKIWRESSKIRLGTNVVAKETEHNK